MNELILKILSEYIPEILENKLESILTVPPNPEMWDISIPCFPFAAILKSNPAKVAEDFAQRFEWNEKVTAKVIGPYLNLTLSDKFLLDEFVKSKKLYEWEKKNQKIKFR